MKFYVLTDTHLYSKRNWRGDPYKHDSSTDQLQMRESEEILLEAFDHILKDKETDVVLITGDITNNGELDSHKDLLEILNKVKQSGKKIYLTTSTHDFCYDDETSYGFDADGNYMEDIEVVRRDQLFEMYKDFGFNQALDVHMPDMSYVIDLDDKHRVLMLNDDEDGSGERNGLCGYSKNQMEWIKKHIKKAADDGKYLFATTHHPVIPPASIYALISEKDMLKDYKIMREFFADNGINFIFTGHSHMHKIGYNISQKGNILYNIGTGALPSYPAAFRHVDMDLEKGIVDVKTIQLQSLSRYDLKGKTLGEYTRTGAVGMVENTLKYMSKDRDIFAAYARAISIPRSLVFTYWPVIKILGKYIDKLTYKKIWRWTKKETDLKLADIGELKDKKFSDVLVYFIERLYAGDPDIAPDTPQFKLTMAFIAVLESIFGVFKKNVKISPVVQELLYKDSISDWDAKIDLNILPKKQESLSYTSKKGPKVVGSLIALSVVFSPILLPFLLLCYVVFKIRAKKFKNIGEGPHKPILD